MTGIVMTVVNQNKNGTNFAIPNFSIHHIIKKGQDFLNV
jgi:hypothetical protein